MKKSWRAPLLWFARACGLGAVILCGAVYCALQPLPESLLPDTRGAAKYQVVDRAGRPLSYTFAGRWNLGDQLPLYRVPELLQRAFIEAEDRRFYEHHGVDWYARLHAMYQNLKAGRVVRGASTITEQAVRMLHPRTRTLWSRFLEGIEAVQLEERFSKGEILEFYLNQVPFAAKRRGIVQAARYYWDRDLETLTPREQLTLAVLVRAPDRLDLYKRPHGVERGVGELVAQLVRVGALQADRAQLIGNEAPELRRGESPVRADHFVRYILNQALQPEKRERIVSTIDASLQGRVQEILEQRVTDLHAQHVTDGAVLVVDNRTGQVLAWVNAGDFSQEEGSQIDAVLALRQPGSTLKPFLYALALSNGWSAATSIDDSPLAQPVGSGLHTFRNYSRMHYGPVSLREALGNSLNIPAIRTVQFTGKYEFLDFLRRAGFDSLAKPADFYGEGLALGNGEVSLLELVRGYTALANRGVLRQLTVVQGESRQEGTSPTRIASEEVSSIIGDILSDPHARRREFGADGLMRFPIQTALKTGTSSDYRDAWAIGYNAHFTVGVWMGNLNRSSMYEISGARGPALVLRSVFAELSRSTEPQPLFKSATLVHRSVCSISGQLASERCPHMDETFAAGTEPRSECPSKHEAGHREVADGETPHPVRIVMPTPGLNFARDPRIPNSHEAIPFEIVAPQSVTRIRWVVDGIRIAETDGTSRKYLWALQRGHHTVSAQVQQSEDAAWSETDGVDFWVR